MPDRRLFRPVRALALPARWVMHALALLSLGLGVVGIFLPLLPTVPFILLAAALAARSSPRLLAWLESHQHFGPMIRDWRHGGVVSRRAKWLATITMALSAAVILLVVRRPWAAGLGLACMAGVLGWLWLRPERRAGVDPASAS